MWWTLKIAEENSSIDMPSSDHNDDDPDPDSPVHQASSTGRLKMWQKSQFAQQPSTRRAFELVYSSHGSNRRKEYHKAVKLTRQ